MVHYDEALTSLADLHFYCIVPVSTFEPPKRLMRDYQKPSGDELRTSSSHPVMI